MQLLLFRFFILNCLNILKEKKSLILGDRQDPNDFSTFQGYSCLEETRLNKKVRDQRIASYATLIQKGNVV